MALNIKPEFQVEKVTGVFTRPISRIIQDVKVVGHKGDEKRIVINRMEHGTVEFTEGYMLYFPQGHSQLIPADDEDQLRRIGVFSDPRMVDMESGEEVPAGFGMSPKEIVARAEANRPRARNTGGLSTIDQE